MQFNTLKEAVQFRINESEDDYWIEDFWKAEITIFTKNISDTILFFQNDCTDEEFYWLSEVFEELAEITRSRELVTAWRSRLAEVLPENYRQQGFKTEHMRNWVDYAEYVRSIRGEIDSAECIVDSGQE